VIAAEGSRRREADADDIRRHRGDRGNRLSVLEGKRVAVAPRRRHVADRRPLRNGWNREEKQRADQRT
jgi:hypothetical protein